MCSPKSERRTAEMPWLPPLKWGVVLGVTVGFCLALGVELRQHYLPHHLFKTAAWALALRVNVASLASVLGVAVLLGVVACEKRLSRTARWIVNIVLAVAAAHVVALKFGGMDVLRGIPKLRHDTYAWQAVRAGIRWDVIAVATLVIVLGVLMRMSRPKTARDKLKVSSLLAGLRRLALNDGLLLPFPIALLTVNLVAAGLAAHAALPSRDKPPIVFIAVCSLRTNHLGCYGYPLPTTPEIDRLAQESTRYEHALAQASWTRPSVASFLSAQHPVTIGLALTEVDDRFVMMAEALKEHGYATAGVSSNYNAGVSTNDSQGFDSFDETGAEYDVSSPEVTMCALRHIREFDGRPFFLFLLYSDPHQPYEFHPDFGVGPPDEGTCLGAVDARVLPEMPDQVGRALTCYDSEIRFTDYHIGMVLEELRKRGLYDEALILFAADHGEGFGAHGVFAHGETLYEELIHVPLLVKLPGQKEGRVAAGQVALMDLFPSVMREIGMDATAYGLAGEALDLRRPSESAGRMFLSATEFDQAHLRAAQRDGYKLIINMATLEQELYHLPSDPDEQTNIFKQEPGGADELRQAILTLEREAESAGMAVGRRPEDAFTSEELERLHSLGYTQ